MLGAVLAADRNEHLSLTLFLAALTAPARPFVSATAQATTLALLVALTMPAWAYVQQESFISSPVLSLPGSVRASAILTGIAMIALVMLRNLLRDHRAKSVVVALAVVAVTIASLWLAGPFFRGLGSANIPIFLIGMVVGVLALGVPIAFCFTVGTIAFIALSTFTPLSVVIGRMDEGMSGIVLLAVPIFVMLGCVLDSTGLDKAMVDFLASLLGHVKAGMSYVLLGSLFLVSGIRGRRYRIWSRWHRLYSPR